MNCSFAWNFSFFRLDYFGRINDYQTAAIIICLLSARVKRDFTIPQIKQNVSSCDALISTYHNRSHSSSAVLPVLFYISNCLNFCKFCLNFIASEFFYIKICFMKMFLN